MVYTLLNGELNEQKGIVRERNFKMQMKPIQFKIENFKINETLTAKCHVAKQRTIVPGVLQYNSCVLSKPYDVWHTMQGALSYYTNEYHLIQQGFLGFPRLFPQTGKDTPFANP
jgi:hypothetical protein